jgi:hypothetical protein
MSNQNKTLKAIIKIIGLDRSYFTSAPNIHPIRFADNNWRGKVSDVFDLFGRGWKSS